MTESQTTSDKATNKTDGIARIQLSSMNGVDHGFSTSVDGVRTGGVFVKKEAADEMSGSYVHEAAALAALASDKSPEEVEGIRGSLSDAKRLTVDALPGAKGPNDRLISVEVGQQIVGGGAKFVGNKELLLPDGRYVNEADLKAAIASFRAAAMQPDADVPDALVERGARGSRRILAALATAAMLLSLLSASTSSSHEQAPAQARAVATAPAHSDESSYIQLPTVPPPVEEAQPNAPETQKNWNITEGMGGEDLFNQLSVEPSKWYAIQDTLVNKYPNYFYRSDAGDVRFAYAGDVPTDVQQTILDLIQ